MGNAKLASDTPAPSDKVAVKASRAVKDASIDPASATVAEQLALTKTEVDSQYVRPFRGSYKHIACGTVTTLITDEAAENWSQFPGFWKQALLCKFHNAWFPVGDRAGEFIWVDSLGRDTSTKAGA
jgi:hypothetical protein